MNTWEGQKVRLRAIEPEDWEVHFEWNHDSEMPKNLHYIWFPQSRARVKKWTEEAAVQRPHDDNVDLVIETLAGQQVGTIGVQNADPRNGTFKYGIAILREHQRQGYASEAIRLVLRHYFEQLRYQKVIATVYGFNEASQKLHESLGFQLEGRLRRMIYSNGQYHDELIYGLTCDEFRLQGHYSKTN